MNIAVLGNPLSWYFSDLQRAAKLCNSNGASDLNFTSLPFSTIQAKLKTTQAGPILSAGQSLDIFDAILVRTMPPGSLEQVVFRMNALHLYERAGGLVLNGARAIEIAVDKYLSLGLLAEAGINVPETIVCQTAEEALEAFEALGGDVVIKPVFGGEGRGITRVSDPALAIRAVRMLEQLEGIIYLQRFIPHDGSDIRVFVLGDKTFSMRRVNTNDWRTNISLGGRGEPYDADSSLIELAKRAAEICQADIAGVDILLDHSGGPVVLEVNAVPGWRGLTEVIGQDVGYEVAQYLIKRVQQQASSPSQLSTESSTL